MSISPANRPWAERFAEIALRALRRVHLDYGAIHVGNQWMKNAPALAELNHGIGVAAADELTVCAAITQECLLSPYFSGSWVKANKKANVVEGKRYWILDREKCYSESQKRVDFVIKRVPEMGGNTELGKDNTRECYIEAKRVRRWTTESLECAEYNSASPILNEIDNDIKKLQLEFKHRPGEIFGHLLLWDIYETKDNQATLEGFFKNGILSNLQLHQLRWLPIDWRHEHASTSPPTIAKWLWLALLEVHQ